ncbi:MAG TPA: SIMPL domain-containing protein [Chloroflexia bacterium]|nr:SIMPL domain-containing protein [Chloroflexia bacterium]
MEKSRNKVMMALGSAGAVLLLLGAFMVVWLTPRGPEVSNANVQSGQGPGTIIGSTGGTQDKLNMSPINQAGGTFVSDLPRISVRGTGLVSAKPDMANLQIGVQIQNTSLDAAQSEATTKMNAAMQQLKAAGVDEKDISTSQFNVEPVMEYRENQPPRVTGFRVTNILNVKLRDIAKAGKVIDDLVKAGANTVYGLSFGFSDPGALMKQAREQAMNDAKAKASELAALGGVTLGTPLLIDDGGANVPPVVMDAGAVRNVAQDMAAMPVPINPGQQEIRVEVSVVYAIK